MTLLAWHFLPDDGRLRYPHHGKRLKVKPGMKLTIGRGKRPVMWVLGLHASIRAIDALYYADGAQICRVKLGGEIVRERDKCCASSREVLWMADATRTLHEFACWCEERALTSERNAGREPDPRSWRAIAVKRAWLDGRATDAELDAARAAAWDAAGYAALDALNKQLETMLGKLETRET